MNNQENKSDYVSPELDSDNQEQEGQSWEVFDSNLEGEGQNELTVEALEQINASEQSDILEAGKEAQDAFSHPETLKSGMEGNNGWKVVSRPVEQWYKKHEVTTDHPFGRFKGWLKSFSRPERKAKKINEELWTEFKDDRSKYPESNLEYKPGTGLQGITVSKRAILATGFKECSGLVFQTSDEVAVVHISPNVFRDISMGDVGEDVRDYNVWGHIRFALKEMLSKGQNEHPKATKNTDLSKDEIAELQKMINSGDLKLTMLSGEHDVVPYNIALMSGELAKLNKLPYMKTEIHYVGAMGGVGGYAIYASPEGMYYIGSNGKIMKQGVNLPPTMYEYKEKS